MRIKKLLGGLALSMAVFTGLALSNNADVKAAENDAVVLDENEVSEAGAELTFKGNTSFYRYDDEDVWSDGDYWYKGANKITKSFFFDGNYTYYLEWDGTPMCDKLTYHPDGVHIIYFDEDGHEVFNDFVYCPSVGYTCYFGSDGYIYKDQITFDEYGNPMYLNANGKLEDEGWFRFANGRDFGFAEPNGYLRNYGFDYDPWGRVVYYHWNGMVARGLIQDNNFYYSMDETDGHYLGKFATGNPLYFGAGEDEVRYIGGINIPTGEVMTSPIQKGAFNNWIDYCSADHYQYIYGCMGNWIFNIQDGDILTMTDCYVSYDPASTPCVLDYWNDSETGQVYYAFEGKVGTHLPAGTYLIKLGEWSYVEILNSSLFSPNGAVEYPVFDEYGNWTAPSDETEVNRLFNRRYYCSSNDLGAGKDEIYVTVTDGEILRVDCALDVIYVDGGISVKNMLQ